MPASNLEYTNDDLGREVCRDLGVTNSDGTWANTPSWVQEIIQSGYRTFLNPGAIEGVGPHRWSFLRKTTTITTGTSQSKALPEEFESIVGDFTGTTATTRVVVVDEQRLRSIAAQSGVAAGVPKYAAIRTGTIPTTTVSHLSEVVWYPTPSSDDTLTYTYDVKPTFPTVAGYALYGGIQHAETILLACLAMAEMRAKDMKGERYERYVSALKNSIDFDKTVWQRPASDIFPVGTASSTQDHLFADIQREVGGETGYGWDPVGWSHAEAEHVKVLINRGMRKSYQPIPIPGEKASHRWRFLMPQLSIVLWESQAVTAGVYVSDSVHSAGTITLTGVGTTFYPSMVGHTITVTGQSAYVITSYNSATEIECAGSDGWATQTTTTFSIAADGNYRLPAAFIGMKGPLHHEATSGKAYSPLPFTTNTNVYEHRAIYPTTTGRPEAVAVELVASDGTVQYASDAVTSQAHDLMVMPIPDDDYTVGGEYDIMPPVLSSSAPYPLGGPAYHEMFLASCVAEAEFARTGERGPKYGVFLERLVAAVWHDRRAIQGEVLGPNLDRSDRIRREGRHEFTDNVTTYS